ncbi:hypothetical protein EMIHUDRAFT_210674 [Emiliania huxleyi CCMP1516]|uniref:Rubisco LSMT substrate-binding domain-containing protein n=2 Tax=Emiliania huxleyi TaxID=2903 RepID=A0A0D3IYI3_EMIH1|nr:hypothetical protein EMIHUDRAFT_210674 [Emiliania huxleyi CCMP1516]EOD16318.1 hypothetical protein EMIHUDRAFT_210674 [Emiliania huxleyi CCMP1516]|eukprot:XP_005768747.1 hypothetical protein EMIHUDRAFT_210674 [Emiliania huxleyi CCMP1516]
MPLTLERLRELQSECLADDLELPAEAVAWIESEARAYFESGGVELPRPRGLESAEIHAFYDMRREEARSSSAALLRETLGSAEVWPQLAAALRARGDAASASALAAWSREEPQALLAELASLGLKMGHRQRLLLVLQHRHMRVCYSKKYRDLLAKPPDASTQQWRVALQGALAAVDLCIELLT